MTGFLARLRRSARALVAIAAFASLLPSFAQGARAASLPTLVVCTAEGLVAIPLGDAPATHEREPCAACLRADLPALPTPPAVLTLPPLTAIARSVPLPDPPPPVAPTGPRQARAPPAFA